MKKKFLTLFLMSMLFGFCLLPHGDMYAADNGNGVDVTYIDNVHSFGVHGEWYSSFDPSSLTYIYNESGGATATSGLLDIKDSLGPKTLYVSIPTLNSTSITVRAECKPKALTVWHEVHTEVYTAATTIAETWPLLEYSGDFRVGLIVVGDSSGDVVDVSGDFVSPKK